MLPQPLAARLPNISHDAEAVFLIDFLHGMTVAFRAVAAEELDDAAKIGALQMMNEINHRALNRLRGLRHDVPTRDATWELIANHVQSAPAIRGHVGWALTQAFARHEA